jgi:hypothetical protein
MTASSALKSLDAVAKKKDTAAGKPISFAF